MAKNNGTRDQADALRKMTQERSYAPPSAGPNGARVIAVTSGKGGVGKTNVVANLAVLLARGQHSVLIFDADLGLANVDVALGLSPKYNLQHFIYGERTLTEVMVTGPCEVKVIPGASGIVELVNLREDQRRELVASLDSLGSTADVILVDTSPGISRNVIGFAGAADEVIVVTTPEPTAVTDAYATVKVLSRESTTPDLKLLVNMAQNRYEAEEVAGRLTLVAKQFLNVAVESLGYLPKDNNVPLAVRQQAPFVLAYPSSPATNSLRLVAGRLHLDCESAVRPGRWSFFEKMARALLPAAQ